MAEKLAWMTEDAYSFQNECYAVFRSRVLLSLEKIINVHTI